MKQTVLLGVTSGIAAYKMLELVEKLHAAGHEVFVTMTSSARKMVSVAEFEKASGHPIFSELYPQDFDYKKVLQDRHVDHIDLADKTDLMVIAPATANTIAKLANGIADDFLTTTALAVTAPIILCPSMNLNMWNNPVVQENLAKLRARGIQIIEPSSGMLACGYEGKGRLEDIKIIYDEIIRRLHKTTSLQGKKILITAGGTQEKIDEVRFITNKSSGKMGVALAEECYLRGAEVLLLRASNSVTPRYQIPQMCFETADDLLSLIEASISDFDFIYHTAAISDFYIENAKDGKISSKDAISLELSPRQKILDKIKQFHRDISLIAFKAEYNLPEKELIKTAKARLIESDADAIVANDISKSDRGFQADTNEVIVILKNGDVQKLPLAPKKVIAQQILDIIHGE